MSQHRSTNIPPFDRDAAFYLARIRQIDKILEGPVKTLIALTAKPRMASDGRLSSKRDLYFPTWISEAPVPRNDDNRLTRAICSATLQRVWRIRRRFQWLDSKTIEQLRADREELLAKSFMPRVRNNFYQCARIIDSKTFGGLNPFTASQVFRVLLDKGEDYAHSGIGFLAFFAMIWPLARSFPNRLTVGARIEPWETTAYVTAKCLLPIRKLQGIIKRRADLFDHIVKNLVRLEESINRNNPRDRWLFNIELDDLSANLFQLSLVAINKNAYAICAERIARISSKKDLEYKTAYSAVLQHFNAALRNTRETSKKVLKDASTIVRQIERLVRKPLEKRAFRSRRKTSFNDSLERNLHLKFAAEHINNPDYWNDLAKAVAGSVKICQDALNELNTASKLSLKPIRSGVQPMAKSIKTALAELARANRNVKEVLNKPVNDAALWCRSVVDREIAHATAENLTDFDPNELVSGIAVAVAWDLMTTPLQVSDAVRKAIVGARKDGSWRSGKPYYSSDHALGVWATTSDLVWTLSTAIEQFPEVTDADEELFKFVDWLERTQQNLITKLHTHALSNELIGWGSERLRSRGKIHLGTTALSVNALLEVRDLAEYRLWELCTKRFSVVTVDKPLRKIDPVDLGAVHSRRLHRQFAEMAYLSKMNRDDAKYSLVLHGPPGSSKTKLAEALSREMWKFSNRWGPRESRVIRITPADFTRMGEERLDSEARAIFDLISGVRAVTVFFDEIDDLLRQRNFEKGHPPSFIELVIPAMLNRLADLRSACPRQEICFVLATNFVENIDSALIRKGRIDQSIPVVYPDFVAREAITINEVRKNTETEKHNNKSEILRVRRVRKFLEDRSCRQRIAKETAGWPYLALLLLCSDLVDQLLSKSSGDRHRIFERALCDAKAEYGSSFSRPTYEKRLAIDNQELMNEYCHHIISQPSTCPEVFALLKADGDRFGCKVPKSLKEMLAAVLRREGRCQRGKKIT
jgi:hypothetical protein